IENITSSHRSQPHNPDIANTFFKMGLIESWGRGVEKVIKASKVYNGTTPTFTWDNGLNVEFKSRYPKQKDEKLGKKVGESSPKTEEKIMDIISQDNTITTGKMAEALNISKRAILKQISKLKEQGLLQRVGGAKGGHWLIK
ncbi:MAG: HTH domain-containing protein, partial [Sulfurimonas sp.]|uniref:ATP-binding protein n=1 Tax=Sulfurimonas sp. TaxID=2022749 RepID=UPI0028CE53D6